MWRLSESFPVATRRTAAKTPDGPKRIFPVGRNTKRNSCQTAAVHNKKKSWTSYKKNSEGRSNYPRAVKPSYCTCCRVSAHSYWLLRPDVSRELQRQGVKCARSMGCSIRKPENCPPNALGEQLDLNERAAILDQGGFPATHSILELLRNPRPESRS